MESNHSTFRRVDGALGVGFIMQYAGTKQAAIAWPDAEPRRYIYDDLDRNGIADISEQMPVPAVTMESRSIESHEPISETESLDSEQSAAESAGQQFPAGDELPTAEVQVADEPPLSETSQVVVEASDANTAINLDPPVNLEASTAPDVAEPATATPSDSDSTPPSAN